MTVHFISVGISVLTALRDARTDRRLDTNQNLRSAIHRARPRPHLLLEEAEVLADQAAADQRNREKANTWFATGLNPPVDPAKRLITECCDQLKIGEWPSDISAELATFAHVPQASRFLSPDDTAILITSDTPDGLVAALWNALALTEGDVDRVRYRDGVEARGTDDVVATLGADLAGHAVIARIPGMDAGTPDGFVQAMRGLGTLGRRLLDNLARQPYDFYLSGGYKAAIPYLIGLAEGMRGRPGTGPVRAYVLHETTDPANDTPIELPLRALNPEWIRTELETFDTTSGRSEYEPPAPQAMRGYAYSKVDDHWELTAFGAGLAELFKSAEELRQ